MLAYFVNGPGRMLPDGFGGMRRKGPQRIKQFRAALVPCQQAHLSQHPIGQRKVRANHLPQRP